MDYSIFLKMLHDEIDHTSHPTGRHQIIRFMKPQQYRDCLIQLSKMKPSLSKLQHIRASHLIRALIVPLPSSARLHHFNSEVTIEQDTRIQVHSNFRNPKSEGGIGIPWGVKQIRAPKAWSTSTGHKIKIAVIDTGADYQHPDLRHSLARGINLLNRSMLPLDDNGHGTHIAGTIAAANSTEGIIGVAPRSVIYPVKAFDNQGSAYVSDIILGIDWCVRNRVDIINMSFGMRTKSKALLDVVNRATKQGIVIVASSGNDGKRRSIDYPARYSQTISVGATDENRHIADFSNRGPHVDIYAPGKNINSCWVQGKYHEMSGTSMATSHVSGAIALLMAERPGLTPDEIKNLIKKTATPLRPRKSARGSEQGGELHALRLLQEGMKG
ncbi:S8 family peptidase [Paenibacillus sp. Marseille-Q4541]|uniref:S8 family peptidase n=1 Tax=Paenibacillus sp. Marseille-Q4541 TaxID=2831522 RepID=UPI001BA87BA3|nr:S8 family peptidase [Paenibacillus sp. Marseille-Q4541]